MRHVLWFCVLSVTFGVSAADVPKGDLQLFQGTWEPVFMKNPEGVESGAEELKSVRLVVTGNDFTLMTKEASISGTFTIDPSKFPKTIDFRLAGNKPTDERFQGIYEIQGERRLSCFALPGQARPRVMRPAEKGYLMFEWKPAAP
jgi:uncharacterized protein (TIGR03067 family)